MSDDSTTRRADAVRTVARRLRLPAGESLARRVLAAVGDGAVADVGPRAAAFASLRVVRRRLDFDVPAPRDADELGVDPRDAAAAERTLVAALSPPADEGDRRRLDAAVDAARERLESAREDETDPADGRARASRPGERPADRRAHLARLEADRSMARLGFVLYDISRGEYDRVGRRTRRDADRA